MRIYYKFITLSAYHAFVEACDKIGIVPNVTKEVNNLNKKIKIWYDDIEANAKQKEFLSEFNYRIIKII